MKLSRLLKTLAAVAALSALPACVERTAVAEVDEETIEHTTDGNGDPTCDCCTKGPDSILAEQFGEAPEITGELISFDELDEEFELEFELEEGAPSEPLASVSPELEEE